MSFIKINLSCKTMIINTDMICYIEENQNQYNVYFPNNYCTLYLSREEVTPLLKAVGMNKEEQEE